METQIARLLFGSYLGILIAVIGSGLLMPELFVEFPHRGLSFWGNYFPALIPYMVGFTVSIACLLLAARAMPDYPERMGVMRRIFLALAFGMTVILLTPEQAGVVFYWAHTLAAVYLFLVAGLGIGWTMLHAGKTSLDWFLFIVFVAGVIVSILSASYIRVLGLLPFGQVLALTSGMLVIFRAALRWSVQEVKE